MVNKKYPTRGRGIGMYNDTDDNCTLSNPVCEP